MKFWKTVLLLAFIARTQPSNAQTNIEAVTVQTQKVFPFEFNGDVRNLPKPVQAAEQHRLNRVRLTPEPQGKNGPPPPEAVPNVPSGPMPSPLTSFDGLAFAGQCGGVNCGDGWPPDTNGAVGLNHYIQAVNSSYGIYSKTGTLLASFTENQFWSGTGSNPCNGNSQGDPVVLYDQLADRWILTHFAFGTSNGSPVSPFYQCIAASKTGDPVSGGWWMYPVRMDPGTTGAPPVGTLNDYSKFGIWTDCLYMSANEFQEPGETFIGTAFASFSRSDLYSGASLTFSVGLLGGSVFTMIPSNVNGIVTSQMPPAGTPNYYVSESQTAFAFEVRKFSAGPNCGAGGTLSTATNVSQTSYFVPNGSVIPQPGTSIKLDSLTDELMQKVQYRNVNGAESLWVVHSTQGAHSQTSQVRPQWAQIDVTGGTIATTPVQQQIYAPDNNLFRWMESIAADNQGNMAIGYSTSNGTAPNFPSIAYSGRLANDPPGTLGQSEVQLIAGGASQTNTCGGAACERWGDYSSMSIDPVDDCTFWYTNEYYTAGNGATGHWQTRIGSFKFPSCSVPFGKKRRGQITSN